MDIIEATQIIENGLIDVHSSYKIVEKDETKMLIRIMGECKKIYDAYDVMSFPLQEDIIEQAEMIQMLNHQIGKKLNVGFRLFRYLLSSQAIRTKMIS